MRVLEVSVADRTPPKRPTNVRILADHQAALRSRFAPMIAPGPRAAIAIVVNAGGGVVVTIPSAHSAAEIKPLS
jgi:hypothetical protein